MNIAATTIPLVFLVLPGSALCQETVAPQEEFEKGCFANELELSRCRAELRLVRERELDNVRDGVANQLEREKLSDFRRSESKWDDYKDAACEFDVVGAAGNSKAARKVHCEITLLTARRNLLSRYLRCLVGANCGNDVRLYMLEGGSFQTPAADR